VADQPIEPAVVAAISAYIGVICIIVLAIVAFSIWCYWRIAVKAGYPGPFSLLLLVPGANLILLILFAFSEWPVERDLKALRTAGAGGYPPYPPPYVPPGGPPPPGPPMTTG
jgi:hypothetical protein